MGLREQTPRGQQTPGANIPRTKGDQAQSNWSPSQIELTNHGLHP